MNHSKPASNQLLLPRHILAFHNPETYAHPTHDIKMIQTHISWVFLTGEFVYKLKKPVDFGFLDFSTLAKRKYYCEQELRLNQRLSPAIYLEVLPVCLSKGRYNLSGSGEVVDYCLKMIQFEQTDLFDKKLEQGDLKAEWMDDLAKDVAAFHAVAELNADQKYNHISYLKEHIQGNLNIASEHIGKVITEQELDFLMAFAKAELGNKQSLLEQRQEEHFIRHCHGDLHFRNITLLDGKPSLFDCIEFNDEFRIIDTMNDVAFLVMDCDAHNRPGLGFRFLSRYLELSADYMGLMLLPLYLFYRAGVRGKVACLLASSLLPEQQQPHWAEAKKYLTLAASYSKKNQPELFAIGGLSGSGKSHLSLLGCGIERAIIIRSDAVRKRISRDYPEFELYSSQMSDKTYQTMFEAASRALKAGYSVILDATFLKADLRQQVFELATEHDSPLHFYWLDFDKEILKQRVSKRSKEQQDISDADLSVLDLQLTDYQPPDEHWICKLHSNDIWPAKE